ncbi:MAG: hypothetical protein N3G76_00105 [Candidatus Micrarchaeota archaeon]|nr:hypothetical protein [Candidatus Micrarchaeota archaeon]
MAHVLGRCKAHSQNCSVIQRVRTRQGQASIELISILAVALLVLGILMATSRSAFEDMQASLDSQLTERSLRELAGLAKLAYDGGPGSTQKSVLHVPSTVVQNESYISGRIINIRLEQKYGVKDVPQVFQFPISGDLSFAPGDYEVYAVSHTGYVFITENPSLAVSRTLIYARPGEEVSVKVRNPGSKSTVITTKPTGGIGLSWQSQEIAAGAEAELKIIPLSSGKVQLTSSSGERETISVEVR